MLTKLRRFGLDGFVIALLVTLVLSALFPEWGRSGGILHVDFYTNYGISVVFLIYGLTLSWDKVKAGVMNWRLHLVVTLATFVLYPVLVWGAGTLLRDAVPPEVRLGFFYLAASPSTISSSVAMTSIAGGNIAGAIFNASFSSLIGVFATPLWVNWYLAQSGQALDLGHVIVKIVLLVLVPIGLGQALRPWLAAWAARQRVLVMVLDRGTILAIVFNSFADSVHDGNWNGRGIPLVAEMIVGSLVLFFAVFFILDIVCRALRFDRGDIIAGMFCGTKKSLASGIPMARIMFGSSPALGMIVLPFVIYHFLQLVAASIIARRWALSTPVAVPQESAG